MTLPMWVLKSVPKCGDANGRGFQAKGVLSLIVHEDILREVDI